MPLNDLVDTAAKRLRVSGMAWVSYILHHYQIMCWLMCSDLGFGIGGVPVFKNVASTCSQETPLGATQNFALVWKTLG